MPQATISQAFSYGLQIQSGFLTGMATLFYPLPGEDGAHKLTMAMVPLADDLDVERLRTLATVMATANAKIMAAQNPADAMAAKIQGNKDKDEATRQISAEKEGKPQIVIASG